MYKKYTFSVGILIFTHQHIDAHTHTLGYTHWHTITFTHCSKSYKSQVLTFWAFLIILMVTKNNGNISWALLWSQGFQKRYHMWGCNNKILVKMPQILQIPCTEHSLLNWWLEDLAQIVSIYFKFNPFYAKCRLFADLFGPKNTKMRTLLQNMRACMCT